MPIETEIFTVRLPVDLLTALQREAQLRGVTPSELVRAAVAGFLSGDVAGTRHTELLYEVAKTRSVIMRFIDKQLGEPAADQLLDNAEGDAQTYLRKKHRGE
jgi:hypothetical protein